MISFIISSGLVASSRRWEKLWKSRKNFFNWEKTFLIEKKLSELRKKFWNPENYFRVKRKKKKQNEIMKLRKKIKIRIEKYFVTRIEKKSWIQWLPIQWTIFIIQDKRRNKRNLLPLARVLTIKCEKCDLFTTLLSRYLMTLKFIETKERKACLRNIK